MREKVREQRAEREERKNNIENGEERKAIAKNDFCNGRPEKWTLLNPMFKSLLDHLLHQLASKSERST